MCPADLSTAKTVHVCPSCGAHGETSAPPVVGQASSPAATPTHAASTSRTSAGAGRVPQATQAPEQGIDASWRAQLVEGADGSAQTRREGPGMPTQSAIAPVGNAG